MLYRLICLSYFLLSLLFFKFRVLDKLDNPVYSKLDSPVYSKLDSPVYSKLDSPVYYSLFLFVDEVFLDLVF
jgi:hypothetical protein